MKQTTNIHKSGVCNTLLLLYILLLTITTRVNAQSVKLDLPRHPGRTVTVMLKQGTRADTVFMGKLDNRGQAIVHIAKEHKDYRGMAVLQPDLQGAYFEFIMAGEDMTLHCDEEYPHGGNVTFEHSPENDSLNVWFTGQAIRQQKIGLLGELERLYAQTVENSTNRRGVSHTPELNTPATTILVFYETGCGNCDTEMQELKKHYPQIQEMGYRVISISSDTDERIFLNTAGQFPWEEKYCDLQGFDGEDFKNYGVIGTPTIFVIDEEGIIQGRT